MKDTAASNFGKRTFPVLGTSHLVGLQNSAIAAKKTIISHPSQVFDEMRSAEKISNQPKVLFKNDSNVPDSAQ